MVAANLNVEDKENIVNGSLLNMSKKIKKMP